MLCSGVLLQRWSWVSIFVGLTAAGLVLLTAAFTLAESREQQHQAMDYAGSVTVALAIGLIVIGVTEAPARGWTDPLASIFRPGGGGGRTRCRGGLADLGFRGLAAFGGPVSPGGAGFPSASGSFVVGG